MRRRRSGRLRGREGAEPIVATSPLSDRRTAPPTGEPMPPPKPVTAPNGWVAIDDYRDGGSIFLVRPGEDARRLEVPGSDGTSDACPAWSPDGTRLMFGRHGGTSESPSGDAELVIVPVGQNGTAGAPTVIGLDGFEALGVAEGYGEAHPCGTWAPDGRWVAFAGTDGVWVVDTQAGEIRRLPGLRPTDLEWRPGTDELTIAGDLGTDWETDPPVSAPVTVYSVSTGELSHLGSLEAAQITWSPDGTSLAFTGMDGSSLANSSESDPGQLVLVDGDGTNERVLVADIGLAVQGLGPVWSPTGDRIVYQRCEGWPDVVGCNGEEHDVVLVSVADGTETVIEPPTADGREWYPYSVSWSTDGTTLLYAAWADDGEGEDGVIAVPADMPSDARVLSDSIDPGGYWSHRWTRIQMWGRQPR